MSLDELIETFQHPDYADFGGAVMVQFLESCADLLRRQGLFFAKSHSALCISRFQDYSTSREHPIVTAWTDGLMIDLAYEEKWDDGPYIRSRCDKIRCGPKHARAALVELLNRLTPGDAT